MGIGSKSSTTTPLCKNCKYGGRETTSKE